MLTKIEQVEIVAKLLHIPIKSIYENSALIEHLNALYFSEPVKGGGSIIIGEDGSVLFANSWIDYSEHLKDFENGIRTPLEMFNDR